MNIKNLFRSILAMLLVATMMLSIVACGDGDPADTSAGTGTQGPGNEVATGWEDEKVYTYNTYTALSPSNWNELTYQDNNDTQIMSYIGSSFFSYDFKYDENGEIVPGEFVMKYDAATKLEDVSSKYVGDKWGIEEGSKGFAYKITLREDLKWDDGTPIKAEDFVYTMKEQLNPDFRNYRADSFYVGGTVIVNAENYAKQGQTSVVDNGASGKYVLADLVKGDDGVYKQASGANAWFPLTTALSWGSDYSVTELTEMGYLDADSLAGLQALADENGNVAITDDSIALVTTLINTANWGNEGPENIPNYIFYDFTYSETKWEDVGIFVGDTEYEIILVLAKALPLLKEDGSLSYQAAYNMDSLPLVHKAKYEANKVAPTEGTELWTSTYNSSVETTASWGAYKLESFQSGTQYVLSRNDNWYGYNEENKGLYQTDRIVCDTVKEWNSAWLMFQAGEIDGIGIDVTIAEDYKGSDRAYFTPDDFVASLQLQSDVEQLKARETDGVNKSIMGYTDFRMALSLSINRAEFATQTTTSSLAGFGLFNSMHYYDVENGGVYRNSDEAKKVLCEIYNVDYTKYDTLDKAVDAITGYDLDAARALVDKAYDAALAAGDIKEGDKVVITMGSGAINETVQRRFDYITNAWKELVKGTKLEGKLETEVKDFADAWANDFRAGAYDVCMGGWTGAAWDPGYFLLAYLDAGYMYSAAWPTDTVTMKFTMKGVGEGGADIEEEMTLLDWYACLNGSAGAKYDWSANALEQSQRLQLIAALEKEVLKVYYTVPLYNNFSASLLSYKVDYVTYEYNTFMGYGGMKYMTYNFDDTEWAAEVAAQDGQLNYK